LLHELAHLKRGDIVTGWIVAILQSLPWFNPVIWWAFYRMRCDRETACDALVLSRMSDGARRHYGDALIGTMERFNHPQHQPAIVAGIIENKEQLKRRLVMIKKFRCPARREIAAVAVLFAVLSIALLTEPRPLLSQTGGITATDSAVEEALASARKALGGAGKIDGIESLIVKGKVIRAIFSSSSESKTPGVMMKTDTFAYDTEIRILLPDNIIQIDLFPVGNKGPYNLFPPSTESTTAYSGLSQGKSLGPLSEVMIFNGVTLQPDADARARIEAKDANTQLDQWSRNLAGMLAKSGPVPLTLSSGTTPGVFALSKADGELGEVEFDSKTGYPSVVRHKTAGPPTTISSVDPETGKITRSKGPVSMVDAEIRFRDRFSVDGVMFPRVIHWLMPGTRDMELWINEVQINPNLSLEDFHAPEPVTDPNHRLENIQPPKM
jgi:hypothetical protein